MEAQWQADRSALRDLLHTRPDLSLKEKARRLNRSYTWAKEWAGRLAAAPADDLDVLHSRSRARLTPPEDWDPLVLRRIEQIRLHPPEGLQRTPGPKAILYYLPRDALTSGKGVSSPTIYEYRLADAQTVRAAGREACHRSPGRAVL